ncbi:uncharacterized protein LOC106088878 [Stomoxys calcitrans]|uniref:uncharacterized protein LOC106088878 n=1 Tax=Stomoxys calcitrans TaxID=35570 RepID=UPI0027E2A208|nr:uncharacterized protein LOC106088878 [Stomoxys calcitrans]
MAFISLLFAVLLLCVRPARLYANATASRYDAVVKRQKRFLVFEKGASITLQGNNAKSILPGVPRGLNVLFEYTVFYDLPTGLDLIKKKFAALESRFTTKAPDRPSTMRPPNLLHFPQMWSDGSTAQHRRYSKCKRKNFYELYEGYSAICLKRTKRVADMQRLTTSERLFYDVMEKWSLLHGFQPRNCFMRTLCEARHLLLPYGYSLLHDVIHIFLRCADH